MAHDYPLEELGPRAFEQLAVALALKVLGPGVEGFGSGPDGGREATYEGPANWSATTGVGDGSWNGYVVIQAKQREHPSDPHNNAVWLRKQIDAEFDSWISATSKRGRFPQYIVFVTNVRLSSTSGSGGIDSLNQIIRERIFGDDSHGKPRTPLHARGLRDWKLWHRDQINALLTVHDSIRNAFPAMLTAGDILARLQALPGLRDSQELHRVLTAHASNTLATERWVSFSEAGGGNRQSVENVIIDLRMDSSFGNETTALQEIVRQGDAVLKASMTTSGQQRHVVITGQPGNGKSTVSRFLTQAYRTQFMDGETSSGTANEVMQGTQAALQRLELPAPRNRRWPIRVELAELADDLGPSGDKSLLRWLSEKVSRRAEIDIKPHTLKHWMRLWPWIVILDGLDEVTSPQVRRRVLDEIELFADEADQIDADLLLVVTTRPTGYTERLAPQHFTQFDLRYFDVAAAVEYGRMITSRRLADDLDRRDQVLARFEKHAADSGMARLMKTPLQVLIMTLILERLGNLPADRYQLFWRYYETVYDREAAKNLTLATLLAQHRSSITELHETVAITLHRHAETSTDAQSLLPTADLYRLAEERLLEVGHTDASRLAAELVTAATKRLVLLVPSEDDTVAFEVRPLQELMAARALTNGTDDEIRRRLTVTARSPHWRNTWVFAAGRLFSEGPDHRRNLVTSLIEAIDKQPDWPGWLCASGPELAADILDDGLATTTPKWQRSLIDVALRALTGAGSVFLSARSLARGLTAAAATGNNLMHIRGALKSALAGTPKSRAMAALIAYNGTFGSAIPGMPQQLPMQPGISESEHAELSTLADLLSPQLAEIQESTDTLTKVQAALTELQRLVHSQDSDTFHSIASPETDEWPYTVEALRDPDASTVINLLFNDLDPKLWTVQEVLALAVWPPLSRTPVGQHVASELTRRAQH